jgi:hypothetical protein
MIFSPSTSDPAWSGPAGFNHDSHKSSRIRYWRWSGGSVQNSASSLAVGHQQAQFAHVGFVNNLALSQGSFAFARFLGQNMTGMRFVIHKLPGSCSLEPFGSRTVGFNFRHNPFSLIMSFFTAAWGRLNFRF